MNPYVDAIRSTAQLGSAAFTTLATFERYIAVYKPLETKTLCTRRRACQASILTTLLVVLFYSLPRWWDFEVIKINSKNDNLTQEYKYKVISTEFRQNPTYKMFYLRWGFFIVNCALPFILLLLMNWSICRAVKKSNKTLQALMITSIQRKEILLTKMLICVTTVSLLVKRLILFLTIIDTFWALEISTYLWWIAKPLVILNSSINCLFSSIVFLEELFGMNFLKLNTCRSNKSTLFGGKSNKQVVGSRNTDSTTTHSSTSAI